VSRVAGAYSGAKRLQPTECPPEHTGTRVQMEAEVTGNLLWKLFLGMISGVMEKQDGEYLSRLKDAIEKNVPA